MPRVLKTKYPCRECGEPAEVMHTSHAPDAICGPCAKRRRHMEIIALTDHRAAKLAADGNDLKRPESERLAKWLRAISVELEAAAKCMESVPDVRPGETLHMWRCGRSRLFIAVSTILKMDELLESAREEIVVGLRVEVLDGAGEGAAAESPETGAPAPPLRLVRPHP